LVRLLVFPGVQPQTAFHQDGTALLQILADRFCLTAKSVDIDESDFFLGLSGFSLPGAIDGQANLRNGCALRRLAQFGVARQVSSENDFVKVGHKTSGVARA